MFLLEIRKDEPSSMTQKRRENSLRIQLFLHEILRKKGGKNFFYQYLLHLLNFFLREVDFYGNNHVCE